MSGNDTGVAFTREQLASDLWGLGVEPGDLLFVHSSFKSLGRVEGGAETVIRALEGALGPEGLLVLPSFNLTEKSQEGRARTWRAGDARSTVGWLTEFFRNMPGTVRSEHYSHSVAARGKGASEFVGDHLCRRGLRSPWDYDEWGFTYGEGSPLIKAYRHPRGKLLMLGVDYHSSTFCHVVEVTDWNRCLANDPEAEYYWVDREKAGAYWDSLGRLSRGRVGAADCRLFGIRDYVDTLLGLAEKDPGQLFKWHPSTTGREAT